MMCAGHSDVVMGAICVNDDELADKLRYFANGNKTSASSLSLTHSLTHSHSHTTAAGGAVPSPFDCYLANRGMKTLHVRMREHQKSAMAVAQYLESSPYIEKVLYPGLASHPQHELVKRQAKGFSGMVTIYMKGDIQKFCDSIKVSFGRLKFQSTSSVVCVSLIYIVLVRNVWPGGALIRGEPGFR